MLSTMEPMLSATVKNINLLNYPLYASPKLDGIRAVITERGILSRKLKPIPNLFTQKLFSYNNQVGLDGELIVGNPTDKNCFRNTTKGIMSKEGNPNVFFYVFDIFNLPKDTEYVFRESILHNSSSYGLNIIIHSSKIIHSANELISYEEECLNKGYEGVMLRTPRGLYKYGRSTLKEEYLIKLKRFSDSEAIIIGFNELLINNNEKTKDELGHSKRSDSLENLIKANTLGSLSVKDIKTNVMFEIGSGFNKEDRQLIWNTKTDYINKIIKYKHFEIGVKDKPRFPVYLGIRNEIDL